MHYYLIATASLVHRAQSSFTYHSDEELTIGAIVLVSVGKKQVVGIVTHRVARPTFTTKPVEDCIEATPLPHQLIKLAEWMSTYYYAHPATTWQSILPRGLQKKRRETKKTLSHPKRERTQIVLTDEQAAAISTITQSPPGTVLLEGVTGSGKTQVYIELAKKSLSEGRSSIILVPEIALTSQLVAEFMQHFSDVIVTHSTMTEAERHTAWRRCLTAEKPIIVIGPRSALFSPLKNIGTIVIDESHEPSFKQEQSPRYSALRTASILATFHKAHLILGSATPSITDRYLAEQAQRPIVRLSKTARQDATPPNTTIIDMTKKENFTRHRFFSNKLIEQLQETLQRSEQSLIFHNRRGSAPTTLCEQCSWSAGCARCFVPLTLHTDSFTLVCHLCNHQEKVPTSCPECQTTNIIHKGIGTKLIAEELQKIFPKAHIARFDADAAQSETLHNRYQELYDGTIDIVIGTQVIAKGLDLPKLRTVGVVQADSGLALPDYQSSERVFQLIAQVRGRVGRSRHASNIIIQTYQPQHTSIIHGVTQDYEAFFKDAILERKRAHFPPFTHLLKLTCSYKTEAGAIRACRELAKKLRTAKHQDVNILGPAPAFYERVRDIYRWQLILKSPKREHLIALLAHIPPAKWQAELDPMSLL